MLKFICLCMTKSLPSDKKDQLTRIITTQDWNKIIRYADATLLLPALYSGLKRHNLLHHLDAETSEFLESIHALNSHRNSSIKYQAIELIKLLNTADIEPILLKGIAGLLTDLHEDPAERVMSDIDILINPNDLPTAIDILLKNNYKFYKEPSSHDLDMTYKHHAPPLVSEGNLASVELHIRPAPLAGKKTLLDFDSANKGSKPINIQGARALLPTPEVRLLHNFNHSQHQDGKNYFFGRIHIRGLLDWIRLTDKFEDNVDWSAVIERISTHSRSRSFSAYLLNASEYFGYVQPISKLSTGFAKLHILRQKAIINFPPLGKANETICYFLSGIWIMLSPSLARKQFGDLSLAKVYKFRFMRLLNMDFYYNRYRDLQKIFRIK